MKFRQISVRTRQSTLWNFITCLMKQHEDNTDVHTYSWCVFYDSDININIGLLRLSPKHQLVHKEKKSPYALSVSHHNRKGALRHRPTQGWTVDEASILCKVSIYSLTVQPRVGRWMIQPTDPWRQNEACRWAFLLLIFNNKRERCMPHGNCITIMQFYVGIIAYSRDCRLILRNQYL